jgi:hypothetical protein
LVDCDFEEACNEDLLHELFDGVDRSPRAVIVPANSLTGELSALLRHLHAIEPDRGWGQHLGPDGQVDWSTVHVQGWSRGGTISRVVSTYAPVKSATFFAAFFEHGDAGIRPDAQPVTTGSALRLVSHVEELDRHTDELLPFTSAVGMDLDARLLIDDDPWPWSPGTQVFTTESGLKGSTCNPHSWVADDLCIDPLVLERPYRDYFCTLDDPLFLNP